MFYDVDTNSRGEKTSNRFTIRSSSIPTLKEEARSPRILEQTVRESVIRQKRKSVTGKIDYQHPLSYRFNNCLPEERRLSTKNTTHPSCQTMNVVSGKPFKEVKLKGKKIVPQCQIELPITRLL